MAALVLGAPEAANASSCSATAIKAAEQFVDHLDARDYKRAYALLAPKMRASLPYEAFTAKFDSRRKALGGSSMGYALKGDTQLALQVGRKRLYALGGPSCRVTFRAQFRKATVDEWVTVTAGKTPLVSDFRDAAVRY